VKFLRDFGATEVHIRISCPPIKDICYLGIDMHEKKSLIAFKQKDVNGVKEFLGADSLAYLSKEGMLSNPYLLKDNYCTHCFDGKRIIQRR
jgi:amidophosphoribosyltransferase